MKLIAYISLLRIKSWVKNLFVFTPLVFSLNLFNEEALLKSLAGFVSFCMLSSVVYIFNDIADIRKDRVHPRKKFRPLASGKVSVTAASIIAGLVLILSAIVMFLFLPDRFILVAGIYFVLNIFYTVIGKRINLVEILLLSSNLVIRVVAGSTAIGVYTSEWIIIVTFFVALMLTFIKRKSELIVLGKHAEEHRRVLKYYTVGILDKLIYISATVTICSYMLYTINDKVTGIFHTDKLIYSVIFVVAGIFRFIQLSENNNYDNEGDPTLLILKDWFLKITILLWILYILFVIYFHL